MNEFDAYPAAWLRNLYPAATVDERSITEVRPADLEGFTQCHFFAGIGGWPYALRLAGWPSDRPIWTGSCPCQPFSAAGRQAGSADERDLWPAWFRLIRECHPDTIAGEQVAGAIGHGWLDRVCADLEREGYAVGAIVLGAHSVGAPHLRQRLYWVADADGGQSRHGGLQPGREHGQQPEDSGARWLADHEGHGRREGGADDAGCGAGTGAQGPGRGPADDGRSGGMGDAECPRLEGHAGHGDDGHEPGRLGTRALGPAPAAGESFWSSAVWLPCRDGKARRVEPSIFPLAHGVSGRVGQLRAYGNAIIPQVAAAFVRAYLDVEATRPRGGERSRG